MSYYQKYRPEKIADLDLSQAREAFLRMMAAGEVAHAYLLIGPRGSGKTSSARILARLVNCEKNIGKEKLKEPCGECEACVSIKNGSAPDVLEIDAASHRGIDDIRDLREKARLSPVSLSRKVYIIDEVHMLTTEAFNALLKTLEEPPAHVMFILCTTEAHKVPETIASRCMRINFMKAGGAEMVNSLMRAAKGEGLLVDKEAIELLADNVDGSFREGHKLLEQMALGSDKITIETVRAGLRLVGSDQINALLMAVKEKQPGDVLDIIHSLETDGVEVNSLVAKLLATIREKIAKEIEAGRAINRSEVRLINNLIMVVPKLKISPLPFLPLEMVLLRDILRGGKGGSYKTQSVISTEVEKSLNSQTRKGSLDYARDDKVDAQDDKRVVVQNDKFEKEKEDVIANVAPLAEISFEKIEDGWQELLTRLTPRNQSVAGLLRSARPKELDSRFLTIEVFYKFHKDQLEQDAKRRMIEDEVRKLWGPLSVRCILGIKGAVMPIVGDEEIAKAAEEIFGA